MEPASARTARPAVPETLGAVYHEAMRIGKRVIVAGGANLDIQGRSHSRFLPADSNPGKVSRYPGGVGRNIAENLARLGFEVQLISAFGDDAEGASLIEDCRSKGIDCSLSPRTSQPTPSYLCLLDPRGILVGAVADMEAMDEIDPAYFESRASDLEKADWIVADANLRPDSLSWLAARFGRRSENRRCKLFFDPVSATKAMRAAPFFGDFDCAKPNRAEALALAGMAQEAALKATREAALKAAQEAARALATSGRLPRSLYISLGEEGIYCAESPGVLVHYARPEALPRAVNGSGAGDSACAAILWAESEGYSPAERAEFALTASALTAAAPEPVSPRMSPEALIELRKRLFGEEASR
ncbi:MAG TPA: carbohydrate kinase family protein [Rectinemataceae bacterium]